MKARESSRAVRNRVAPAAEAFSRPALGLLADGADPSASALNASAMTPVASEPTNSPRVPTAAVAIDTPVSNCRAVGRQAQRAGAVAGHVPDRCR